MDSWVPIITFALGALSGYLAFLQLERRAAASLQAEAQRLLDQARKEAEHHKKETEVAVRGELLKEREEVQKELSVLRDALQEREGRLRTHEEAVDRKREQHEEAVDRKREQHEERGQRLDRRMGRLEEQEETLKASARALDEREAAIELLRDEQTEELSRVAGLSKKEGTALLLERLEKEVEHECGEVVLRIQERTQEQAERKAREVLTIAIQRVASDHAQQALVSTVSLPNEEMKGRIIGREGRNIRTFERATGTDVIVDDTPGLIVLSSFDGVRREIARRAMEKLIADGRIHPTRIEEVVAETIEETNQHILDTGKAAIVEVSVPGVHERIVTLLGRLKYRTSYGQNVLQHSIEVAQLCGTLAGELGLDVGLAKRCGLLHDIGKAVDHELEGGHPEIGAEFGRRYNEPAEVVNAIASHHGGCPQTSLYAYVVMAADAVSGARPGARGESLERYIHRLAKLEEVATGFPGVKQAYAIQAGREVRVVVNATKITDKQAGRLAREIAHKIEGDLTYPGEIKVTLMRETRVIEYAR